jgi:hypothetical protein
VTKISKTGEFRSAMFAKAYTSAAFRRDFAKVAKSNQRVIPYLLAANDRLKSHDLGSSDLSHRYGSISKCGIA